MALYVGCVWLAAVLGAVAIVQCDAIRWEQFKNWHFSRRYNFWINPLILILKTPIRPYSCLAKVIFCPEFV